MPRRWSQIQKAKEENPPRFIGALHHQAINDQFQAKVSRRSAKTFLLGQSFQRFSQTPLSRQGYTKKNSCQDDNTSDTIASRQLLQSGSPHNMIPPFTNNSIIQKAVNKKSKKKSTRGTPIPISELFDPKAYEEAQAEKRKREREIEQERQRKEDSVSIGDVNPIDLETHELAYCSGALMRRNGNYYHVFYKSGQKKGENGGTLYEVYLLSDHRKPPNFIFDIGTVHMHPLDNRNDQWEVSEKQFETIMKASTPPNHLSKAANELDQ